MTPLQFGNRRPTRSASRRRRRQPLALERLDDRVLLSVPGNDPSTSADVRTYVLDGTGHLDALTAADDVWRYVEGTGWKEIDAVGDVRTLVVDGTGRLDVLNTADDVWRYVEGTGWKEIDAVGDVRTLVVDGTGRLDVLTATYNGGLIPVDDVWRYIEGSGWTEIDAAGDVQTLVVHSDGSLWVETVGGGWTRIG
jgi:hypothetical protein